MEANNTVVAAARDGDLVALNKLIAEGVDPNSPNAAGATAIEMAAERADEPMVRLLLANGASPNRADFDKGYSSALIRAATKGHAGIVKLLLTSGAEVDLIDDANQQTALMWASAYGRSFEVVELLLDAGANVAKQDIYGNTALVLADHFGFREIAEAIRRRGG